jgi:hypothetical protein
MDPVLLIVIVGVAALVVAVAIAYALDVFVGTLTCRFSPGGRVRGAGIVSPHHCVNCNQSLMWHEIAAAIADVEFAEAMRASGGDRREGRIECHQRPLNLPSRRPWARVLSRGHAARAAAAVAAEPAQALHQASRSSRRASRARHHRAARRASGRRPLRARRRRAPLPASQLAGLELCRAPSSTCPMRRRSKSWSSRTTSARTSTRSRRPTGSRGC